MNGTTQKQSHHHDQPQKTLEKHFNGDPGRMQDALTKSYAKASQKLRGTRVAPVGETWRKVLASANPPALHAGDGSHPGPHGRYLAACVLYRTITGKAVSARRLPKGLGPGDAASLRAAAMMVR